MEKYRIGIDLGGTTITAGLVDDALNILEKLTWDTSLPRPLESLEQHIAELCHALTEKAGLPFKRVSSVGIGTPGSVNSETGMVGFNANFGYYNWNLGQDMEALLGCPVYVENDANAAAYGEYLAGGAKGADSAVCVTLGTGIGGGIILNGKIYSGSNHAGGEIGHMTIQYGGRLCNCGRRGCWERYGSSRALVEDTRQAMQQSKDSLLWKLADGDLDNVNAKLIFEASAQGDALGQQMLQQWIDYVACGIVDVINIFQPDVVCIGGGVSAQGEVLLAPIRKIVEQEDYNRTGEHRTVLKTAELHNNAGVLGAACLDGQKQ